MLFKQPAELNKYDFKPPTRALRWQAFRLFFPLVLFCWAILAELVLAEAWLNGDHLVVKLPWVLVSLVVLLFLPFVFELEAKLSQRIKHTLHIDDVGFKISANKLRGFAWKRLLAWHLEPVGSNDELRKLKMEFSYFGKGKRGTHWSIILEEPDQIGLLKSELEKIRQNGAILPPLIELPTPSPKKPLPGPEFIWLHTISFYLIWHAPILLIPGIMLSFPKTFPSSHSDSPPGEKNLARLIAHHFSTVEEFRNFLLITGGCLFLLAVVFYIWANRISRANKLEQGCAATLPS
jgi:hypothetical protein